MGGPSKKVVCSHTLFQSGLLGWAPNPIPSFLGIKRPKRDCDRFVEMLRPSIHKRAKFT